MEDEGSHLLLGLGLLADHLLELLGLGAHSGHGGIVKSS
jgi:hypothetical protein